MAKIAESPWKALNQEKADLAKEGRALLEAAATEGRNLTAEEKTRDDGIASRLNEITEQLGRLDRYNQEQAPQQREARSSVSIHDLSADKPFRTIGEQLQAIAQVALGNIGPRERLLNVVNFPDIRADAEGAGEAIDSDGGFLVQQDFATTIMKRMNEMGQVLNRVRRIPLGPNSNGIKLPQVDETSRVDGSRWGGIRGYWVEEGEAATASRAKFDRLNLELHRVAALGYATDELLADAPAMNIIFTEGFAEELTFKVEDAIIEGDGAGKPQGILNASAVVSVSKETGQTAATIVHNNLKKMWARLHARSQGSAVWYINQDCGPTLDDLAKIIGTGGVEPNYVTYGPDGVLRIKGRPVIPIEYCSAVGTVGDIILADMSQYAFIDKGGVQQAQSIHVRFTTHEMTFRATYRCDGGSMWKSALTPFKGSATQSPFITLATRA